MRLHRSIIMGRLLPMGICSSADRIQQAASSILAFSGAHYWRHGLRSVRAFSRRGKYCSICCRRHFTQHLIPFSMTMYVIFYSSPQSQLVCCCIVVNNTRRPCFGSIEQLVEAGSARHSLPRAARGARRETRGASVPALRWRPTLRPVSCAVAHEYVHLNRSRAMLAPESYSNTTERAKLVMI